MSNNDAIFHSILTGTSPYAADEFSKAVAERFKVIEQGEAFEHRDQNYPGAHCGFCYDGNRTEAENLGWRTAQTVGFELTPEQIAAGEYDEQIAIGFHEAASSEHWYRFEKDWG
jgi:hypothetical protein